MRVELRPASPADADVFFAHFTDLSARHQAAFVDAAPPDRAAFDARWARILANAHSVTRTILVDDEIAGHVSRFEMDGKPQVTYWIGRVWWGRGVATRALTLFLDEVRERPLYASAAADNVASIRVLEKCGFRRVGTARGSAGARGGEIEEALFELGA